jgi:hypothetical protein
MRSETFAVVWGWLRAAVAVLLAAAVMVQFVRSVTRAIENGQDAATVAVNYFSFFTVLSNTLAAIVLAWAAVWLLTRGRREAEEPRGLAVALAAASTYMIVTGIVYNLLLRGVELPLASQPIPWSNEVLHVVGPLFLLLDVFLAPRRRRLSWAAVAAILVFPVVWVTYTLVRGPLVTNPVSGDPYWYPYPFLNPNGAGGTASVVVYVIVIALAITIVAFAVVAIGRRRGARNLQGAERAG